MKRVFAINLMHSTVYSSSPVRLSFEVIAETAQDAIGRALAQARREHAWKGPWIVDRLKHRGPAV